VPLILFPPPPPPPPPPSPPSTSSHQIREEREERQEGRREGWKEKRAEQPPVVIISPLDNVMSVNVFFENRSQVLQYGVQGKVPYGGDRKRKGGGVGLRIPLVHYSFEPLPPFLLP